MFYSLGLLSLSYQSSSCPQRYAVRYLSDKPAPPKKKNGASLFQRITSFAIGAGLMALVTQYYILGEVRFGNKLMIEKQRELEDRLTKLEKKK